MFSNSRESIRISTICILWSLWSILTLFSPLHLIPKYKYLKFSKLMHLGQIFAYLQKIIFPMSQIIFSKNFSFSYSIRVAWSCTNFFFFFFFCHSIFRYEVKYIKLHSPIIYKENQQYKSRIINQ